MQTTEIKLNQIICGKSEEKLKEFPDNFFDGIITDPPYELGFMNKDWDASGIAYNVNLWKECLRVVKPGAYLLCFGGTRTHHRMTCAIEDAGWIIRDEIDWIYGEGFPKSTNISKQLDKEAGAEQKVIGQKIYGNGHIQHNTIPHKNSGIYNFSKQKNIENDRILTIPATDLAKQWDGYGTGLKPAREPIIVAMKPLEQGLSYAENAAKWGVAGLNIDDCRIQYLSKQDKENTLNAKFVGNVHGIVGHFVKNNNLTSFKLKNVSKIQGRFPANVILSHSLDCVFVGTKEINEGAPEGGYIYDDREYQVKGFVKECKPQAASNRGKETIEIWACVPDCPIRIMDNQSGFLHSGKIEKHHKLKQRSIFQNSGETIGLESIGDSGGASRFFYCAKAKYKEKENGCKDFIECVKCGKFDSDWHWIEVDGKKIKEKCIRNDHPTVKPLDLMKYLLNLIRMPLAKENKQVILDPFCGSGSTLIVAEQLDINYIGIDQDINNILISTARVGA